MKKIAEIEKEAILSRLKHFRYNVTRASDSLGITYRTTYTKLKEYGIDSGQLKSLREDAKNDLDSVLKRGKENHTKLVDYVFGYKKPLAKGLK